MESQQWLRKNFPELNRNVGHCLHLFPQNAEDQQCLTRHSGGVEQNRAAKRPAD